jgi:hypothetical protein
VHFFSFPFRGCIENEKVSQQRHRKLPCLRGSYRFQVIDQEMVEKYSKFHGNKEIWPERVGAISETTAKAKLENHT